MWGSHCDTHFIPTGWHRSRKRETNGDHFNSSGEQRRQGDAQSGMQLEEGRVSPCCWGRTQGPAGLVSPAAPCHSLGMLYPAQMHPVSLIVWSLLFCFSLANFYSSLSGHLRWHLLWEVFPESSTVKLNKNSNPLLPPSLISLIHHLSHFLVLACSIADSFMRREALWHLGVWKSLPLFHCYYLAQYGYVLCA